MAVNRRRNGAAGMRDRLSPDDIAACHAAIRAGSRSFHAASLLLPDAIRLAALSIYAFCRDADDCVDLAGNPQSGSAALEARLEAIANGMPSDRHCDRAFHAVMEAYEIPYEVPRALMQGFRWDDEGRRYDNFDDLADYAARVASTVGIMMTIVMGSRDRHVLARAAELGLAMQLTNIARDVGEDARAGRLYLPLSWLREAGIDPDAFLAAPRLGPAIAGVVRRLLEAAEEIYRSAMTGIGGLPPSCRPAISAAALIYREIGREITRNGFDSISRRARTTTSRKIALVAQALPAFATLAPIATAQPHPALAFLVETSARPQKIDGGFDAAAGRFIDILANAALHERRMTALSRGRAQ